MRIQIQNDVHADKNATSTHRCKGGSSLCDCDQGDGILLMSEIKFVFNFATLILAVHCNFHLPFVAMCLSAVSHWLR